MLTSLIRVALSQRGLWVILAAILSILGWWSYQKLPIGAYPDISTTQVQVIVKANGMSPPEVEQRITRPIEIEVRGISRQTMLRSITKHALSVITIDFEDSTDVYWARQQVNERINKVLVSLPEGVEGGLAPITSPLSELFIFMVEGKGRSLQELKSILDWTIRPRLLSIEGVADVNVLGGKTKTFSVEPLPNSLRAFDLTIHDLEEAILKNNRNAGGDRIVKSDEVLLVRTLGQLRTIDDIKNITVATRNGRAIHLADLARVDFGSLTRYGGVTRNGQGEGVQGLVLLRTGANGRKTVAAVKKRLAEIKASLPKGISLPIVYDRSTLINKAVQTVESALLSGIILVLVVLSLFLRNLRSAISTGIILPLTVLGTFLLMYIFDIGANLMSLGGISIAVGILVDASVVMVENIQTHFEENRALDPLHIIFRAASEVARPILIAVLIIVASFLPILTLSGIEGKLFRPLALTISFALGVSLLLSLTVIPAVASYLMKRKQKIATDNPQTIKTRIEVRYRKILSRAIEHRWKTLAFSLLLLVISFALLPFIGREFLPTLNEGTIVIQWEKMPTIALDRSIKMDTKIQKELMTMPEISGVYSRVGSDELRLDPMGFHESDSFLVLAPEKDWKVDSKDALIEKMRKKLSSFIGVNFGFTQPIDMRVSEMLTGVTAMVAVKLFGDDLKELDKLAFKAEHIMKKLRGAVDVQRTPLGGQEYLEVKMHHALMAKHGVSTADINQLISLAVGGRNVSEIIIGNKTVPITLRFAQAYRNSIDTIGALLVKTSTGDFIRLDQLASLEKVEGPVQIQRELGKRLVVLECNVKDRDVVSFVEELKGVLKKDIPLKEGYYFSFGGQFENEKRASDRLLIIGPAVLLLIAFLLSYSFKSIRQALIILANIPFAFIGGIIVLFVFGLYLSVPASVGFIALFGVAIENGVVLIDHFNELRKKGASLNDAIVNGATRRLRPVLMTATLTILGLIPLAIAQGPGAEIQRPLALVVIGGTFSSLLLTLFVLPLIYAWIEHLAERKRSA